MTIEMLVVFDIAIVEMSATTTTTKPRPSANVNCFANISMHSKRFIHPKKKNEKTKTKNTTQLNVCGRFRNCMIVFYL